MTKTQNNAYKDYMTGMKYKDIAKKYHVSMNTVKSWRTRHGWKRPKKSKNKNTSKKRVHPKLSKKVKKGAPKVLPKNDKLSTKQKKFADYYLANGNAYKSAIKAGYSKETAKRGTRMISENIRLKNYINSRMQPIKKSTIMTADESMQLLTAIARGDKKETVFATTADGYSEETKTADLKTRISAVREIMKRYPSVDKLLEVKLRKLTAESKIKEIQAKEIEPENDSGLNSNFKKLSTDELRRLANYDSHYKQSNEIDHK